MGKDDLSWVFEIFSKARKPDPDEERRYEQRRRRAWSMLRRKKAQKKRKQPAVPTPSTEYVRKVELCG